MCIQGVCSPVLQPEARWGDIWGLGWLNFHAKLVREVKRADAREVCTELTAHLKISNSVSREMQCRFQAIGMAELECPAFTYVRHTITKSAEGVSCNIEKIETL